MSNNKQQTAVEWLTDQLGIDGGTMRDKALAMEKEQIINAWMATDNELQRIAAEQYYNETYRR